MLLNLLLKSRDFFLTGGLLLEEGVYLEGVFHTPGSGFALMFHAD